MLTIFYSPHCASIDNEAGRASGHADVPLSVAGREQARELGQHYASYTLDAVFCSDLQRAITTSQFAFADRGLPITSDARLREFDYGDLTQCSRQQIEVETPRRIREPFPNGESVAMAVQRVGAFLRAIFATYDKQTIVVIGHRATKYGLAYWSCDLPLEEIINTPQKWLDIPIFRYEIHMYHLERSASEKGQAREH